MPGTLHTSCDSTDTVLPSGAYTLARQVTVKEMVRNKHAATGDTHTKENNGTLWRSHHTDGGQGGFL